MKSLWGVVFFLIVLGLFAKGTILGDIWPLLLAGLLWIGRSSKGEKPQEQAEEEPRQALPEIFPGASDGSLGFEVPPLSGAPQETVDYWRPTVPIREEDRRQKSLMMQKHDRTRWNQDSQGAEAAAAKTTAPVLTSETLMNAVVYAEILGEPRARRGFRASRC